MSKLIRHTKKRATALFAALLLTALTALLSLVSFVGGPQQSRDGGTPADTQVSGPVAGGASSAVASAKEDDADIASDQEQTQTVRVLTAADKENLRSSAQRAVKLYEPLASQVFDLATSRAESAAAANNAQGPES